MAPLTERVALVLLCVAAAVLPLLLDHAAPKTGSDPQAAAFPGWPAAFEGRALRSLDLGEREARFAEDFPGRIGRFTDGEREIILRHVTRATRSLHPSGECFRATGWDVRPTDGRDAEGRWSCFLATRNERALRVCERIVDARGRGFGDPSEWFWPALVGTSEGPWWAVTVAEEAPR